MVKLQRIRRIWKDKKKGFGLLNWGWVFDRGEGAVQLVIGPKREKGERKRKRKKEKNKREKRKEVFILVISFVEEEKEKEKKEKDREKKIQKGDLFF